MVEEIGNEVKCWYFIKPYQLIHICLYIIYVLYSISQLIRMDEVMNTIRFIVYVLDSNEDYNLVENFH